jgi:hypothetical protein
MYLIETISVGMRGREDGTTHWNEQKKKYSKWTLKLEMGDDIANALTRSDKERLIMAIYD